MEDTALVATMVSDDNMFFETKRDFAKDMVTVYGMSDVIGPISINTEKDPYLQRCYPPYSYQI